MEVKGIVAASDGQFVAGLLIGVFLGLLVGPVLRSWLAWREWVEASREADLAERLLAHLEQEGGHSDEVSSATQDQTCDRGTSAQGRSESPKRTLPGPAGRWQASR
jgi:hypothetical protein